MPKKSIASLRPACSSSRGKTRYSGVGIVAGIYYIECGTLTACVPVKEITNPNPINRGSIDKASYLIKYILPDSHF
jgi:hypothetical protein